MTNPAPRFPSSARRQTIVAGLVLAFICTSPVFARAGADDPAAPGRLAISTDPVGAAVYVDGRLAGKSPLTLDQLTAGDHRVRILHPGYLENGRIVAIEPGKVTTLAAKLTPGQSRVAAPAAAETTAVAPGDPSSSKKKLLWIAVAAGGGVGAALALRDKNAGPSVTGASASPGTAIQAMNVGFAAQGASDPDGDSLTYGWDFGDGGSETGATVTHRYTTSGTFSVGLEVSDGKKSASTSTTVTIKSGTGRWVGAISLNPNSCSTTVNLTQTATALSGNYSDCAGLAGPLTGAVDTAGVVTFTINVPGFEPFTFRGSPSSDINGLTGVANGSGFINNSWSMSRQ